MARTTEHSKIWQLALLAFAMIAIACFARTQVAWGAEASNEDQASSANITTISTADELQAFRDAVNAGDDFAGKTVTLAADIDLSGVAWTPIGASMRSGSGVAAGSTPFAGTFDGGGHTISGLTIMQSATQSKGADYALGLFGAVMGGTVKNLVLENANIASSSSELAGLAVGFLGDGGTVSGVTTEGGIQVKCGCGGVVGRMTARGAIADCTNYAHVIVTGGSGNCGGIVGAAYYTPVGADMQITNCTNHGNVNGLNDIGGIVGLSSAFVSGCTNEGAVIGSGYATGGIAGELKNYGGISDCTNTADITNTSKSQPYGTGGIVGWVRYDGAAPAYAVSAPASITNNVNKGSVSATTGIGVGGIAGVLYSAGTVTGNENQAKTLLGKQFIGGIVGDLQDQGSASLPSSVPEGATIQNNVSTTPLSAMTGDFADAIAYNNDPPASDHVSLFTIEGNGTAWVATRSDTGDTRYASLPFAFAHATNDGTVTLIADAENTGNLDAPASTDVTLNLNGHNLGFAPDAGIVADGDTITVEGTGDVYGLDADGKIAAAPQILIAKAGDDGQAGRILLKGGTYPIDVSSYVAPDHEMKTLDEPDALSNRYEVVPADTTDEPATPGGSDKPATPDTPGQPSTPGTPSTPNTPQATDQPTPTQTSVASEPATTPQLGDDMGLAASLLFLIAAFAATASAIAAFKMRFPKERPLR